MRTTLAPVANGLNANRLAAHPEFYNAALDNCTTGIRLNVQHMARRSRGITVFWSTASAPSCSSLG